MAKKGAPAALQTEVTNDEEWQQILARKGLVLVDVYSDWSGPCLGMVSTLRKVKMEIGGDVLSYAIARNDNISDLERFRAKCEPIWMFIQNGEMVNLMFGAHCPNLQRLLVEEIRRVQQAESPKWLLPVTQRGPEEEARWQESETIRLADEKRQAAKEEAERKAKYEAFLSQMMFELCEETALLLYPWVFRDEEGNPREKDNCPVYTELVHDLFVDCFDVVEETRILLTEEIIEKMFVESELEINDDIIQGLTEGKCMVMRLKGKPPHPSWPVPYPYECPEKTSKCPTRKINDVEDYLLTIINDKPPPLSSDTSLNVEPFFSRYVHIREPDPEIEEDVRRVYPAVWAAPQARSKVHVFRTIFQSYMDMAHPYEEPTPTLPLNAFKFEASKFLAVADAYDHFYDAIERFGVFQFDKPPLAKRLVSSPEDFENKVKYKTDGEVFVVVIRRINEEAFLAFAGIEPYFVTEDNEEAEGIISLYFPEGSVDAVLEEPQEMDDEEELEEEDESEEEADEDEEEEEEIEEIFDPMMNLTDF